MKVLILGATGMIGTAVAGELTRRGHNVIHALRLGATPRDEPPGTEFVEVDPVVAASVSAAATGVDAVVSALGGGRHGRPDLVAEAAPAILAGLEEAGVHRLVVVGGAGSLRDAADNRRVDSPDFPAAGRQGSLAQARSLDIYRAYTGPVQWTYLSPSDHIDPAPEIGQIELGDDELLRGREGQSWVSTGDYARTLVDELESNAHPRRRFTVRTTAEPSGSGGRV